jgi:hypothetical protein
VKLSTLDRYLSFCQSPIPRVNVMSSGRCARRPTRSLMFGTVAAALATDVDRGFHSLDSASAKEIPPGAPRHFRKRISPTVPRWRIKRSFA